MRLWLAVIAITGWLIMLGTRGGRGGRDPGHSADVGDSR